MVVKSARDWRADRWFVAAIVVAIVLRVLPMLLFPTQDCVRDECIYRSVAGRILEGHGLTTTSKGWLPAPGYPYFLALLKAVTGVFFSAKIVQVPLAAISTWTMYAIGWKLEGRKLGLVVAWMFALHPTLIFFTSTLWIETIYIFWLLFAVLWVLEARDGDWRKALAPGLALGVATLFRGVATYLPPIFALALLWPEDGLVSLEGVKQAVRRRWKHALALGLGWVLMVAPYSMYASSRNGGFLVTDATVGHVLFLGNNDFPPLTFDYGNGMLTPGLYARWLRIGRRPCDRNQPPVVSSKCEVQKVREWVMENPEEFASRIPDRLAQLVNPHSFLTRHVRWGYWSGSWFPFPWYLKEFIVFSVMCTSFVVIVGGTIGAWTRARGAFAVMAVGTVLYTTATVALMYGMTRFRLPLEPLWMIFVGMLFTQPRVAVDVLKASTPRAIGLMLTIPVLIGLMLRYLPTGYPMFW